jgi:hypothetical protein
MSVSLPRYFSLTGGARGAFGSACAGALLFAFLWAAALAAEPAPAKPAEEPPALVPPTVVMPDPPGDRDEKEVWSEADIRSQRLKEAIEQEIAAVVPGPPPPPKPKVEKKPTAAKPPAARNGTAQARSQERASGAEAPAAEPKPSASAALPVPPASTEASAGAAPPPEEVTVARRSPASRPAPRPTTEQPAGSGMPELQLVEKYTVAQGLPHEIVSAIYVDETDAWIGTSGGGVGRFNFAEKNWIVTKEVDGLASDQVTDIAKFKGRIYVGTKLGLSVWDGFSWSTMKEFEKVQLLNVGLIARGGELWVAARNMRGGLLLFDGEKWADKTTMRGGMLLNNISDIVFDGDDMWMGTTSRGVSVLRGKNWTDYTVVEGIASNFVYTLGVIKGKCFLGGCCGLSYFDGGKWTIYDIPDGLAHSTVNAIVTEGNLVWLGTKNGLSVFDGDVFHNFFVEDGLLVDNRVTALYVIGEDLWVGSVGGLSRLRRSY